MSDPEDRPRLDSLEERYAYQEASLEELTRRVLGLEQLVDQQKLQIDRLEQVLRTYEQQSAPPIVDEKPPHY